LKERNAALLASNLEQKKREEVLAEEKERVRLEKIESENRKKECEVCNEMAPDKKDWITLFNCKCCVHVDC